jgi:hypothetical protein
MRVKTFLGVVALLVVAVAAIVTLSGSRVVLVARGEVYLDSYPLPKRVVGCDDLKSYPAVHVRQADGSEGYVIEGTYSLMGSSVWSSTVNSPISFFCP